MAELYVHPIYKVLNRLIRFLPYSIRDYGNYVIFRLDLPKFELTEFEKHHCDEYNFSWLTPERVPELRQFGMSYSQYGKRLAAGHICLIAEQQGLIQGFVWARFDRAAFAYGTRREVLLFKLVKDESFIYDLFVLPEHRYGVGYFLTVEFMKQLRDQGRGCIYSVVNFNNKFSIKNSLRHNSYPVAIEHIYRIGFLRMNLRGLRSEFKEVKNQLLKS